MQTTLFEDQVPDEWAIFHDESECKEERFLYHGYLCVRRSEGRRILDELLQPVPELENNYGKRIHFTALRGLQGVRAMTALHWIRLARDKWLPGGSFRFYCLGINLHNINYEIYRNSGTFASDIASKEERVYRRFYEIGLRATLAWFTIDPEHVSHVYYDQGKQDIDRFTRSLAICGAQTVVEPLQNDCLLSGKDLSKFLQVTDVLLGTVRRSFCKITSAATTQRKCVEALDDVIGSQLDKSSRYNKTSKYWKRIAISFFPARGDLTAEEFFARNLEYHRKVKDSFYYKRKTFREREADAMQYGLF